MVELINSYPTVLDALVTCDESWIYCYDPKTKRQFPAEACLFSQIQEGQTEQIHLQILRILFFWQHWHDLHALCSHWIDSQQGKDNAPVHNSILVTEYLTKMGIKTVLRPPYSPDLAPVTFGYSLSSEAVVMRQLRRLKRLWRRSLTRSHKRTSMGPFRSCWNGTTSALQPEEITWKGTRISSVYYQ